MTVGRLPALACAALLAACNGTSGGGAGSAQPTTAGAAATGAPTSKPIPTPPPTADPAIIQEVVLGEPVFGIAAAGSTVWVEGDNRLVQLDAVTGQQLQELPGWWPTVTGDSLWYVRDDELVEADPGTGEQRNAYESELPGTAVANGVQWAADEERHRLQAFDLHKNTVIHTAELPAGEPKWVQPWGGVVWVMIDGSGGIALRVDASTGEIIDEVDAGSRPHSVALGFESMWVTDHGSANVFRLAPDGTLEATIPGPGLNVGIAASEDSIWAAGATTLEQIDPATNLLVGQVRLGPGDWYGLTYAAGYLWLTSADAGRVLQIKPPA